MEIKFLDGKFSAWINYICNEEPVLVWEQNDESLVIPPSVEENLFEALGFPVDGYMFYGDDEVVVPDKTPDEIERILREFLGG
jgi:hypothetical protein